MALAAIIWPVAGKSSDANVRITKIEYDEEGDRIGVCVALTPKGQSECESVDFKITPFGRLLKLLGGGVKYGTIRSETITRVYFYCDKNEGGKGWLRQCNLCDFMIEATNCVKR